MKKIEGRYLSEISDLINDLEKCGYDLINYSDKPKAFDNFVVYFSNDKETLKIIRERSQFILAGNKEDLVLNGLWKAFDSMAEFRKALIAWIIKRK